MQKYNSASHSFVCTPSYVQHATGTVLFCFRCRQPTIVQFWFEVSTDGGAGYYLQVDNTAAWLWDVPVRSSRAASGAADRISFDWFKSTKVW